MACYFINGTIMLVIVIYLLQEIVDVYINNKILHLGSNYEVNLNIFIGQINTLKKICRF